MEEIEFLEKVIESLQEIIKEIRENEDKTTESQLQLEVQCCEKMIEISRNKIYDITNKANVVREKLEETAKRSPAGFSVLCKLKKRLEENEKR